MKSLKMKLTAILLALTVLLSVSVVSAEDATESSVLMEFESLIKSATPEERQEMLAGLMLYMLFVDGSDSIEKAFESIGTVSEQAEDEIGMEESAAENSGKVENAEYVEFPIVFDGYDFEVYLTGWKSCQFYGGDLGYEFSVTIYNNSNTDYEFGVKDLKLNGWNLHTEGTYSSIVKLAAGEKARETWQVSGVVEKAGLSSLDEVEEISGCFFLGDADRWGVELVTREITITAGDIAKLECMD